MNMFHEMAALELNPHWTFWILLPLLPVAVVAIAYLYYQQRRLASRGAMVLLTFVRVALLLLLIGLVLRPAGKWTYTRTSSGTLWLLLDQSGSMQSKDQQATLSERVHWAEQLGHLSATVREAKPDLVAAHFAAVANDFDFLRMEGSLSLSGKTAEEDRAAAVALGDHLAAWGKSVEAVRNMAGRDSSFKSPRGASVIDALERIGSASRSGASAARSAATLRDANVAVPWAMLQTNLSYAKRDLPVIVAESDAAFAAAHGSDPGVSVATGHVTDVSRSDMAYAFLTGTEKRADRSLRDLLGKYRVRIASFADSAQTAGTVDASTYNDMVRAALNTSDAATASATNMATGLQTVGEQIGPDEPASIIIVSDGRHNTTGDPTEAARLLAARGVRVYGLLVGSHAVSADAAVDQIDSPDWVFKGDTLKAAAILRFDGLSGKTAKVELRRGDAVVDTQTVRITGNQMSQRVEFSDKPPESMTAMEYEVRIAELPGEVNIANNRASFRVSVKKDKLYALLIDDRPRWEYRYLAAYLSRDQRLKTQTVLLNPGVVAGVAAPPPVKASPTNPKLEAQLLPETRAEWQAFDLIILGDISPNTLSNTQQQYIAAAVRDKGSTLITIAGERYMPAGLANKPLADILPVTLNPQFDEATISRHKRFGFRPGLAPEGNGSVLGQLALDAQGNALLWSNLSPWYWHSAYTEAKPSASAIWSITELAAPVQVEDVAAGLARVGASRKHALLATMSVGLGKSLYLASDQTWRLRQVYGTNVQDRFWGQVLRWAVGSDLPAGGKFVRFGSNQPRYAQGQPVVITARILREDLTPYSGLNFSAVARPVKVGTATSPSTSTTEARFVESPETPGYYRATLGGLAPGDVEISLQGSEVERLLNNDPTVTQKTLIVKILPQLDLEQRNMNTDPALLARVAEAGGGFSVDACYVDVLASHLPQIQRTEKITEEVGFFTDPAARGTKIAHWVYLGLFAALLTAEWVIRKMVGLV
jgi:hypothetical protein